MYGWAFLWQKTNIVSHRLQQYDMREGRRGKRGGERLTGVAKHSLDGGLIPVPKDLLFTLCEVLPTPP
jgi:hypothetical protein